MLAKPIVGVVKEHARNGVVVVLTNQGFPGCWVLPWERDPANFGIGINLSEIAVASEGQDSRTLLQSEVKRAGLLAKRIKAFFLARKVLLSDQSINW